jgi:hypothetical protein
MMQIVLNIIHYDIGIDVNMFDEPKVPADEAINPIYIMDCPNDPISLVEECDLELKASMLIYGKGSIELRWQPSIEAQFKLETTNCRSDLVAHRAEQAILNVASDPILNLSVRITNSSTHLPFSEDTLPSCNLGGLVVESRQDSRVVCDEIKFHIVNMDA